ncbi:hypothetical protein TcasGA2_TC000521 [Tribolium castaneum]|uniref:Uncharacterized protein n=1 Tax=Tribolium castaneum TaxID=7070 RepID=D6W9U7_TRICA|nr:hypothetical protein TcasGA2_TC000521 [Tribolium castaneum]
MKIAFLLAYAILTSKRVRSAAVQAPLDTISSEEITDADRKTLEFLNQYFPLRPKREETTDSDPKPLELLNQYFPPSTKKADITDSDPKPLELLNQYFPPSTKKADITDSDPKTLEFLNQYFPQSVKRSDITESDKKAIEFLNHYLAPRPKRSGEEALHHLKASISHGIKSKLGLIAKSSASASAHFSKSSSSGHDHHHHHYHHHDEHPEFYDHHHKHFDFWSLKKSILNTLLQAVKAIKGGVIAIKGQLIKGSGYLISAKGKLISAKGEAITTLGKNIATSAILSPTHGHSDDYGHGHYHHEEYGSPSAPGPEYEVPEHHYHHHSPHHEDKPDADHAGILILKKIPKHEHEHEHDHLPVEHKIPDFKPIGHSGPGLGEIIGKFFSASTSLKPGEPAPFGDHYDHDHHHEHYHSDHDHDHDHHHDHDEHYDHSSHSSHSEYHQETHPSSHDDDHDFKHSDADHHNIHDNPSSHYGSPFEEAPAYLNIEEYASESKKQAQTVTQAPTAEPQKIQNAQQPQTPIKYDEIRPLPTAFANTDPQSIKYDEIRPLSAFSNTGIDTSYLQNNDNRPNLFVGSYSNKPNTAFPPYAQQLQSVRPTALALDTASFGGFPNTGVSPTSGSDIKYLAPPGVGPQVFPSGVNTQRYPQSVKYQGLLDSFPSPSHKTPLKRPTRSKHHHGRKRPTDELTVLAGYYNYYEHFDPYF